MGPAERGCDRPHRRVRASRRSRAGEVSKREGSGSSRRLLAIALASHLGSQDCPPVTFSQGILRSTNRVRPRPNRVVRPLRPPAFLAPRRRTTRCRFDDTTSRRPSRAITRRSPTASAASNSRTPSRRAAGASCASRRSAASPHGERQGDPRLRLGRLPGRAAHRPLPLTPWTGPSCADVDAQALSALGRALLDDAARVMDVEERCRMNARWQYVDPPARGRGPPLRPRRGRSGPSAGPGPAPRRGRRAEFFYDGFDFWRQLRSGERQAVSRLDVPASGWWHKPACNCPLCAARLSTTRSAESRRQATLMISPITPPSGGRYSGDRERRGSMPRRPRLRAAGCATVLSVYNGSSFCALHERARARCPALRPVATRRAHLLSTAASPSRRRTRIAATAATAAAWRRSRGASAPPCARRPLSRSRPSRRWPRPPTGATPR